MESLDRSSNPPSRRPSERSSASFGAPSALATLTFIPDLITAGDVSGDGKPDLVAAGGSTLAVLKGLGGGAFAAPQTYALPSTIRGNLVNLAVADFNGDGRADVVVIMGAQIASSGGAYVYIANADGTLKAPVQIDNSTNLRALAVGDINGDGRVDIAVASLDPQFYSSPNVLRGVRVFRGNADGSFSAPLTLTPGTNYVALGIGDVNKDGKNDLVVAGEDSTLNGSIYMLPSQGDGTFGAATSFVLPGGGNGVNSLAIGDFTFDGNPDVMLAGSAYTQVLIGNSDGTFAGGNALTIADRASYVVAADLNHDTILDALVAVNGGIVPLVRVASALSSTTTPPSTNDFTVGITSSSGTVTSGQSVQTTLSLAFGRTFNQPVSFTCANLPANARCSFSPASVTPSSGIATTTVTIATGAVQTASLGRLDRAGGSSAIGGASLAWIACVGFVAFATRRRLRPWQQALSWFAFAVIAFGIVAGCGGGGGGGDGGANGGNRGVVAITPSGSYPITITATGGGVSKSAGYSLTVQ